MDRRVSLPFAAAVLAAAPLAAMAQGLPAAGVATAARVAAPSHPAALSVQRDVWLRPPRGVPPTQPMRLPKAQPDLPAVEIPARPEWRDDQGFRLSLNRLSYKQRF